MFPGAHALRGHPRPDALRPGAPKTRRRGAAAWVATQSVGKRIRLWLRRYEERRYFVGGIAWACSAWAAGSTVFAVRPQKAWARSRKAPHTRQQSAMLNTGQSIR